MTSGIDVPFELALLLSAVALVVGVWFGQQRSDRRLDPRKAAAGDPLRAFMTPAALAEAIDLAARRDKRRAQSQAVLHGRIDQLAAFRTVWTAEARAQVREQVAGVMRAGLRRGDRFSINPGAHDSDGFTIHVPGADERAAVRIAERLRRTIAQTRLTHLGSEARLTASFGVAADDIGEAIEIIDDRAASALKAARARGADHVVPASEIQEILYLPAASPAPAASAA